MTYSYRPRVTTRLILLFLFSILAASVSAQSNVVLKSFTGSVQGTSNVRDWSSTINDIKCKGLLVSKDGKLDVIKDVEIKILVESIKCSEGKTMDQKTYDAFRYEKFPYIAYTFTTTKVKTDDKNNILLEPIGDLTMGGVKKKIPFTANGKILPNGDLQLYVSKKLDLGDFNIEPPTALMGAVKVDEVIILAFDLLLSEKK